MNKSNNKPAFLWLVALGLAMAQLEVPAQTTNEAPAHKKVVTQDAQSSTTEKSNKGGPFHGKLAAVDKVSKTITVGKRTFQITSETKMKKGGKPATLEEGVVGETVSGYVKPTGDGKLNATTVNFGPKPATADASEKPKASSDKQKQPK